MEKEANPPMHTAEHLLNQTMVRFFGTERCFSAHIEKKKSKCDYHYSKDLNEKDINTIENHINKLIQSDLVVTEKMLKREEAKKIFNLSKIPKELKKIRVIEIGDYDAIPCIGQHVKSIKELGCFKITSSTYENNILRIRYKLKT